MLRPYGSRCRRLTTIGVVNRFLQENETLLLFAQGLVFFALGFAVWLQRRRTTRLRLTQSLIWLAAFGFVEALAVWGTVFVPIQEGYVRPGAIDVLIAVRALLQTGAFVFLFQFGLRLIIRSRPRLITWSLVTTGAWVLLVAVTAIVAHAKGWNIGQWERSLEATARHLLLVPAAIITSFGLVRQGDELADAGLTGIRPAATIMAGAFVVYALLAGLFVDRPFWDPGPAASDGSRFDVFGIELALARSAIGLVVAVVVIKLLEIFEVEATQQLESVDRARAVAEERARFGRDLHDGTIQSLYAAGLHLESVAMMSLESNTRSEVRTVVNGLNATIAGIREYIFGLRSDEVDAQMIAADLHQQARRYGDTTGVQVRFHASGMSSAGIIPDEAHQHLQQVLGEALSNATRHGAAQRIEVELAFSPDELDLVVLDDGTGIADEPAHTGQGLRNMRERARRLGGRAVIERGADGGTRVSLAIPLDFDAQDESEP